MFKAIQPIMLVQPRLHHQFHLRAEYRHSSEVTAAYGVHMHTHLGQKATHRAASVLCNRTVSVLNPSRGYSAPAREFPASFTNLDGTRGILRLGGSDVISFLQGLLTNDANMLNKPSAQPLYAALLNAQGRYLHDMFLYRTKDDKPVILADVDQAALPDLKRKLTMYKLRSDVDIADVSEEFSAWVRFGQGRFPTENWPSDPRLEALGQRTLMGKGDKPPAPDGEVESAPSEHRRWRIEHGVAEGDTEMPSGHAMPLEYNLDALNGISYTKGCYVGQELVARTHNRGVVRKRLMPVSIEGSAPEAGTSVVPASGGAEVGKIRLAENERGLAYLRLKPGLEAAEGRVQLRAGDATVTPWRPEWWPAEWGHEEETAQAA